MSDPRRSARGAEPATVCLFGMPRSGTTWLGKILDSHPDTRYRHEPDSGPSLRAVSITVAPDADGPAAEAVRGFVEGLPERRDARVCGKLPLFAKRHLPGWRGAVHRASVYLAKAVGSTPVLEPVAPRSRPPTVVWKSIESTGRAGLVARAAPNVRMILIVRHPCGHIDSTLRGEETARFGDESTAASDWGIFEHLLATPQARRRGLTMETLRALSPPERLAWRWLLFNEKAMEELDGLSNARVVAYEDLCAAPSDTARSLLQFAGLEWDPAVAAFLESSTATGDDGYYSVYRDPRAAAAGWRRRMDSAVVDRVAAIVAGSAPGRLFDDLRDRASCPDAPDDRATSAPD